MSSCRSTQKMAQFPKSSESGDGRVYGVEGDGRERGKVGVAVGQVRQRRC
jgi:hypothetical protein